MHESKRTIIPVERVEQAIYLIRSQKVMLDRDLAELYGVETRVLNQTVRRQIRRFPPDFLFALTRDEIRNISQIVTCSDIKHARNVFAFTEQGVAMLSGVLNSERAIDVNIAIMRTFVKLRRMLESHAKLARKLAEIESKYDEQFRAVFEVLNQLMEPPDPPRKKIGFSVHEKRAKYSVNSPNQRHRRNLRTSKARP